MSACPDIILNDLERKLMCMCSLVLGGLSKAFFGYGIADYELGEAAMISNIQTGYTVFDDKLGGANQKQKDAFKENVRYLREALAQVQNKHSMQHTRKPSGNDCTGSALCMVDLKPHKYCRGNVVHVVVCS